MWSYGLDPRSNRLIVVKGVESSEGTCDNCLMVEVFNYFLECSNDIVAATATLMHTCAAIATMRSSY